MNVIPRILVSLAFTSVVVLTVGCTDKPAKTTKQAIEEHPDKGPHGGPLAEWGNEEYHIEFTVDHAKKQATVYVLDGSAKKAKPIAVESLTLSLSNSKPPVQITLKAEPQEGDPKGEASRFSGTHEALGVETEFAGEVAGKVGSKPYAGTFDEKEAGHSHEKK